VEAGFVCDKGSPSKCSLLCGNGVIDATEACDDGNTKNGKFFISQIIFLEDGCDSSC